MINRVLSYDQLDCVPRMICEAVVERNTSSPIFTNLANQLPGVFGPSNGPVQGSQQQPGLAGGLSHDPFNGLTTGGGQVPPSSSSSVENTGPVQSQQQQQHPASLTPQGVLSTFLSQIGLAGSSPISSKLYQHGGQVQQLPAAYSHNNNQQLPYSQHQTAGPGYQQPQYPAAAPPNQNVVNAALLQQLQEYQYALQLQQQQQQQLLLDSFPSSSNDGRPGSGSVSFRDLRRRRRSSSSSDEHIKVLFLEGVRNELKRRIAIQVGSMEQLFK